MSIDEILAELVKELRANPQYTDIADLDVAYEAKQALYTRLLTVIGADEPELKYDGTPETEIKNANIRAVNRSKAAQRKALKELFNAGGES